MNYLQNNRSNSGFTFIEMMTALLMIGILSAIAAPSWFALIKTQHLNIAQDQVYQAKRQAQSQAKKEKVKYQASFRTQNNILQWAVHEEKESDLNNPMIKWNDLDDSVQLDPNSTLELDNGVRRVRFDDIGGVTPPLGKITLSSKPGGTAKRCVIVSTILGAMRTAKDNSCN
ncbi:MULTISPECIES: Tfp pilus assembly protein FimT/FimU [Dolichospermum]|jgi:prepilin-type N-terminal cleavage/methylation domain-containing protein|uniref:pilus assembly FimT family protein n=2 Tax=Aphanizomenonaceae TaxID=1892259 RepID=UPI0014481136|nr:MULTISPECIES: prepilin-type N-terminal cleavage/methylation domain-containing protein [Dolichospermum]MDB9435979.1 type II secretion system protein [Dolichospermum lemmermannii CS-548]MTJ33514.1 prepilin-type N-terminal cleavage/methylation domain-containing protein [Dolichospermum sp. UHCC 0260]